MKMAGVETIAALRYIAAFQHKQPSHFLNSSNTEVRPGDRFPMFENKVAWHGDSLNKGFNIELEKTITATAKQIDLFIDQKLPPGRLRNLCSRLCLDTTRWATKLIAYINREDKEVQNYGIPEVKAYTLLSAQLITILNAMWAVRTLMPEFVSGSDLELYAARTVMTTMKAHMIQDEFAELDFKSHNLISSVFIRFLAEETGSNFASGLTDQLAQILKELATLKASVSGKHNGINRRLDSHTDHLKRLCAKTEVKFNALANSSRED